MSGRFSLQTLLLAGLTAVAAALATVAWLIVVITTDDLMAQVDDQLLAAAEVGPVGRLGGGRGPDRGGPAPDGPDRLDPPQIQTDAPERLSPFYEAVVGDDGAVTVVLEPNIPGHDFSLPSIDTEVVTAAQPRVPFTVDSVEGDVRYRLITEPVGPDTFVRAVAVDDVDAAIDRLILVEAIGVAIVLAMLAAVAWWVIRLGIRPVKAMTETAIEMADGDLSIRVPAPKAGGTEAGALATALNTMLGRIETAVDERARSEQRLRQFVADASHELRTPVTTIQGYAELYRFGGLDDPDELSDAMRRTEQEATRMGRLVEDMLMLARLDQERSPDPVPVDLSRVVGDACRNAQVTAADHRLVVTIEPDIEVVGDEDRLWQAVSNVIGNATTHTPPGTTVDITARRDGSHAVVEVVDDGPGIPAEHLDRVTERFYRTDVSRSRNRGGSGLGLAIVQGVMDTHGGSVTVTNPGVGKVGADEVGASGGTAVSLRLPLATDCQETLSNGPANAEQATPDLAPYQTAIVERRSILPGEQ